MLQLYLTALALFHWPSGSQLQPRIDLGGDYEVGYPSALLPSSKITVARMVLLRQDGMLFGALHASYLARVSRSCKAGGREASKFRSSLSVIPPMHTHPPRVRMLLLKERHSESVGRSALLPLKHCRALAVLGCQELLISQFACDEANM